MNRHYPQLAIRDLATALFEAVGASSNDARCVSNALIESSLMGHDSHGVLRIPEYLDQVDQGMVHPRGPMAVDRTSRTTAIVDCGRRFGAVGGQHAMEVAIEMASAERTACVVTRNCNHVGRLGAYTQQAADAGMVAIATCNSPVYGHFVLPWGGREGRLATNPIAYGVPTSGTPIVADFSTSVAPEGKIRYYRNKDQPVPEGWILDAQGQPTTDPNRFYGPPRGGILPLGGTAGHKGFALSLLVELLGSALAGIPCADPATVGNGVCFVVIDPIAFLPRARFCELVEETIAYMKSSPPVDGVSAVVVPGEIEYRTRDERLVSGVPIDPLTWQAIEEQCRKRGVTILEQLRNIG